MSLLSIVRRPLHYSFNNITYWLIGINIGLYLLTKLNPIVYFLLGLNPEAVFNSGYVWQIFTYMFIHDLRSLTHIFLNMFALFIFGIPLERKLGSMEFLLFYLVSGTLTGLLALILGMRVVGASGAIYALLLGFAIFYPETTILIGFVIPLKAKFAVIVFAALSLILNFVDSVSGIAHIVHLGGIVFGFLYFMVRLDIDPIKVLFRRD